MLTKLELRALLWIAINFEVVLIYLALWWWDPSDVLSVSVFNSLSWESIRKDHCVFGAFFVFIIPYTQLDVHFPNPMFDSFLQYSQCIQGLLDEFEYTYTRERWDSWWPTTVLKEKKGPSFTSFVKIMFQFGCPFFITFVV